MPIYEYRRPNGTTFDVLQSMSDDALTVDPDTGVPVERVLHAPAIHFKGKGFYNTDYGTKRRNREQRDADSGGEKSDGKAADKKADGGSSSDGAKPAAETKKADTKPVKKAS
jgi:putative FmdB family regulatory protein